MMSNQKGAIREKNLPQNVYFSANFFSYEQLWSLIDQIYHIKSFDSKSILEIGVGSGLVSYVFKSMNVRFITLDINPNLNPDIVAPIDNISNFVVTGEFDLISCCEVLEHLPYQKFESTIKLFSKSADRLFLTLPDQGKKLGFGGMLRLPKIHRWIGVWFKLPHYKKRMLPDEHFWEIDCNKETRQSEILMVLNKYYREVESGLFKANPYHRYFKCSGAK